MYDVPSRGDVAKVIVTREVVTDDVDPDPDPARGRGQEEEVGLRRPSVGRSSMRVSGCAWEHELARVTLPMPRAVASTQR